MKTVKIEARCSITNSISILAECNADEAPKVMEELKAKYHGMGDFRIVGEEVMHFQTFRSF